jgi:Concanavalin A-like lectin/glucanases superfamily
MTALAFPSSPTLYQQYTVGAKTWYWDGTTWIFGAGPGQDPYWNSVVFLCHGDEAQPVNNGYGHPRDRSSGSNTPIFGTSTSFSSAQTKFGSFSLLNSNTAGSSQGIKNTAGFAGLAFGTNPFTIDVQYYPTSISVNGAIVDLRAPSVNGNYVDIYADVNGVVGVYINSAARIASAANALTINTWNCIRYSRSGGTGVLSVNGTSVGSWADTTSYVAGSLNLLVTSFSTASLNGYVSEVRITNGVDRGLGNQTSRWPDS